MSALLPAIDDRPGTVWFGWSGRGSRTGRARVETHAGDRITMHEITLPESLVDRYYTNFCNGGLWPLLHSFPGRFVVDGEDHRAYRRVNELFASAIARRIRPDDFVWVHDFHLIPLASALRARGFEGRIGFFLHVPFPPPDIFTLMPWARPFVEDLQRFDLVGFHTSEFARNFLRTVRREMAPSTVRTGVFPIGIDPAPFDARSREVDAVRRGEALRHGVHGRRVVLGVDRLDYTKGIVERLRIFARFLELHPRWRRRVSFIQISAPSRTRVAEYVRQRREVEELVGNINGRFGDTEWVPIRYLFQSHDQRDLAAFYREADVALVTPLRDGMNLVCKEYVAAQTGDPGVLVLSRFAGAAEELTDALIVNPYDIDGSARTLAAALEMPLDERRRRQAALLEKVQTQTAAAWARSFLDALCGDDGRDGRGEKKRFARLFDERA